MELISCCCCLTSTQAYSQDPVPKNAAYSQPLFLDASVSYFVWSGNSCDKAKYLADKIKWWQCGKPWLTPIRTVLAIVAVAVLAKLVVQKMADYQGRQGGQPPSSSLLDCCKAARVQQCMPNTYIAYNIGLSGGARAWASVNFRRKIWTCHLVLPVCVRLSCATALAENCAHCYSGCGILEWLVYSSCRRDSWLYRAAPLAPGQCRHGESVGNC